MNCGGLVGESLADQGTVYPEEDKVEKQKMKQEGDYDFEGDSYWLGPVLLQGFQVVEVFFEFAHEGFTLLLRLLHIYFTLFGR